MEWWTWRQLEKRTRRTSPRPTHHLGPSPQAHRALRSWRWSSTKIQQNSTEEITAPTVVDCIHGIHWLQAAAIYSNSSGVRLCVDSSNPNARWLTYCWQWEPPSVGRRLSCWKSTHGWALSSIVQDGLNRWHGRNMLSLPYSRNLARCFHAKPLRLGESTGPLPHAHSQSHFSSLSGSGK